jgi:hypothetical protein
MKKSEKIEGYLRGRMSPAEAQAFEEEMARDAALAREVKVQRLELEVIGQIEIDALRAKIRSLRQEAADEAEAASRPLNKFIVSHLRWWMAAAAGIALLLAAVFLLRKADAFDQLIADAYGRFPPEYSVTPKAASSGPAFATLPLDMLKKRDRSRADVAVRYFQSFASPDTALQARARLNLAHALLLAQKTEQAIQVFAEIEGSAQSSPSARQEAQYYGALALLQKREAERASALLRDIAAQPAHDYQPQAAWLLPLVEALR